MQAVAHMPLNLRSAAIATRNTLDSSYRHDALFDVNGNKGDNMRAILKAIIGAGLVVAALALATPSASATPQPDPVGEIVGDDAPELDPHWGPPHP